MARECPYEDASLCLSRKSELGSGGMSIIRDGDDDTPHMPPCRQKDIYRIHA
jgi:hypothetical protein